MNRPKTSTICATVIVVAYIMLAAGMAMSPVWMAGPTPGLPDLPRVVALHAMLFMGIVVATMTATRGISR